MFSANIVPGQGFQKITVYIKKGGKSATGRALTEQYVKEDKSFFGILAEASQREKEEWRQNKHPITHTIVQYGAMEKAKATDLLVLPDNRKFYVQGADNAGSLNVSMIYYVEERFDINERITDNGSDGD